MGAEKEYKQEPAKEINFVQVTESKSFKKLMHDRKKIYCTVNNLFHGILFLTTGFNLIYNFF